MESEPIADEILAKLPAQFYDRVTKDIPASTWVRILIANPILKREVLEGFSLQPGKFARMLVQPQIIGRIRRRLQNDRDFFKKILAEWEEEQSDTLSYLAMLDGDFIVANWRKIRDLLGPERFCIGLYALGFLTQQRFLDFLGDESFWSEKPDESLFDLLVPVLSAWGVFIDQHPDIAKRFLESEKGAGFAFELEGAGEEQKSRPAPELHERCRRVEKKLEKVQADLGRSVEQVSHLKSENEELRKKWKELEAEFDRKVSETVALRRKEWFERYQYLDREDASKEGTRLESLLQRTRRALELQRRADEEYGLVSDIRAKMLEIDLSLAKIESVYADSLVVHKEVEKVKEALVNEKNRLLKLPGIRRIIGTQHEGGGDLLGRIQLLDPVPSNLSKIKRLQNAIDNLGDLGLIADPTQTRDALRHKKKQILERLYAEYEPGREVTGHARRFRDLEDFIASGESRRYDLFIDGYNVLLRIYKDERGTAVRALQHLREQFIEAVAGKSGHFARVVLVFDGVESSRHTTGNTEVIYTDRTIKSADAEIIERISPRKDKRILLVTADEGIISSVQERIFATIDPIDFYMFLFD